MASNYLARAVCRRDAVGHGKIVEPHDDKMQKLNKHALRQFLVREGAYDPSRSLFNHPYLTFDFTHVFIRGSGVDIEMGGLLFHLVELVVHEDDPDAEAGLVISLNDTIE